MNQLSSKLELKCKLHPNNEVNSIYLRKNGQNPLICFQCKFEQNAPNCEILPIECIINYKKENFYPNYPLLTNPVLKQKIQAISQTTQQTEVKIKDFFGSLKTSFNNHIEKYEKEAKEFVIKLIQQEKDTNKVFEEMKDIDNLQKILNQQGQSNIDKQLKEFISSFWEKADQNTKKIEMKYNQYEKILSHFKSESLLDVSSKINSVFNTLMFLKVENSSQSKQSQETIQKSTNQIELSPIQNQQYDIIFQSPSHFSTCDPQSNITSQFFDPSIYQKNELKERRKLRSYTSLALQEENTAESKIIKTDLEFVPKNQQSIQSTKLKTDSLFFPKNTMSVQSIKVKTDPEFFSNTSHNNLEQYVSSQTKFQEQKQNLIQTKLHSSTSVKQNEQNRGSNVIFEQKSKKNNEILQFKSPKFFIPQYNNVAQNFSNSTTNSSNASFNSQNGMVRQHSYSFQQFPVYDLNIQNKSTQNFYKNDEIVNESSALMNKNNKPTQNNFAKQIQQLNSGKLFLIYDADSNLAIDINDINQKTLLTWHANFKNQQQFYFRALKHQDDLSLMGCFESYACPGFYLSVKENNVCLSNNTQTSISFIRFSLDGFAQISFNSQKVFQLIIEQDQKNQKSKNLKLVQATDKSNFKWAFLVKDKKTFKNERVYLQKIIDNKQFILNSQTGNKFAKIEPADIYQNQNYQLRAISNNEGIYSFYQGSGDICLSCNGQEVQFLPFSSGKSEWIVIRNIISNDYYLMSIHNYYFITLKQQKLISQLENPCIKSGFQSFQIIMVKNQTGK